MTLWKQEGAVILGRSRSKCAGSGEGERRRNDPSMANRGAEVLDTGAVSAPLYRMGNSDEQVGERPRPAEAAAPRD